MSDIAGDRARQHLAVFISLLLMAGMIGFAGSAGFAAGAESVTIGAKLSPQDITVAPGTTITWTSVDGERHRVRSISGPEDLDSGDIDRSTSWSYTFTTTGAYQYVDDRNRDNPALHGKVTVVTGAPGPGSGSPGGGSPGGSTAPAPPPTSASVSMAGKAFTPPTVTVTVAGVVTWTNNDSMPHNVTSSSGAFTSPTLQPGQVFRFTFTAPGTYTYTCTFHGGMNGTVIVPSAAGTVPAPAPPETKPIGKPNGPIPPAVPAAPGQPGKHIIRVSDTGFTPATLDARAGDTVTWVNNGAAPHTATATGGAFDLILNPGASASTVLQAPGTIRYVCTYHSSMAGTINVSAALAGTVIAPPPPPPPPTTQSTKTGRPAAGTGAGPMPAGGGNASSYPVQVKDNTFSPSTVNARVGDTITWTNVGAMPHTVTAGDGSFNRQLAPGQSFSHALRAVGTVRYTCTFHPGMDGTLVVGAALAGVAVPPVSSSATGGGTGAPAPRAAAPPPASSGKAKTYEIRATEMSFAPAMQNARVGDTISWVNVGAIPHTVTAEDGSFDKTIAPGERYNVVLRKQGSLNYVCTFHPGMDGMLMVGPALAGVAVTPESGAAASTGPAALGLPQRHGGTTSYEIQVKDNSFNPAMLAARVGDTVTWVNVGKLPHTVTAKEHSLDAKLAPGERFRLVLTREGSINYVCTPHPSMFGTLSVGPALTDPKAAGPPRTIGAVSRVSMASLGTGWLLVMGLLTTAQLRARAASFGRGLDKPGVPTEEKS